MIWHEKRYTGPSVRNDADQWIRRIEEGELPKKIWLIALPLTAENQLQMFRVKDMHTWYPDSSALEIVGIAGDREEAEELIVQMTQDALVSLGRPSPRELFS